MIISTFKHSVHRSYETPLLPIAEAFPYCLGSAIVGFVILVTLVPFPTWSTHLYPFLSFLECRLGGRFRVFVVVLILRAVICPWARHCLLTVEDIVCNWILWVVVGSREQFANCSSILVWSNLINFRELLYCFQSSTQVYPLRCVKSTFSVPRTCPRPLTAGATIPTCVALLASLMDGRKGSKIASPITH